MKDTNLLKDTRGDALVEAAILFPVMITIFAGLVLLAIYLPTRAALQHATQYAATAIATESSDTWLFYDTDSMGYYRADKKRQLKHVYVNLFSGSKDAVEKGNTIVTSMEAKGVSSKAGVLSVDCRVVNRIVYQEVVVTATRVFTVPLKLSLISFPETIPITVTSTAVVQNGDEFVRNMDLAAEFLKYLTEKLGLTDIASEISSLWDQGATTIGVR